AFWVNRIEAGSDESGPPATCRPIAASQRTDVKGRKRTSDLRTLGLLEHRAFAGEELGHLRPLIGQVDGHDLASSDELPAIGRAAVVRRAYHVPQDVSVRIDAVCINRRGDNFAYDHHAPGPLPGPFDPALEMTRALANARRRDVAGRHRGEARLLDFA